VLFLVLFGVASPCIQTLVEKVKKGKRRKVCPMPLLSSAQGAIKRTTFNPKANDRAHALSARVSHIALAGRSVYRFNLAPWDF
jgi:hypothetical protein